MRIGDPIDRRLATRGKGPSHGRFEHEARLIHEDDMSTPLRCILQDARELFPYPPLDLIVIPVNVLMLRSLARPVEVLLQQTTDIIWVILYPEVLFDDLAYPGPGPEIVEPSVSGRGSAWQPFYGAVSGSISATLMP